MNQSNTNILIKNPSIGITFIGYGRIQEERKVQNQQKISDESPWQREMFDSIYREILKTYVLVDRSLVGVGQIKNSRIEESVYAELRFKLKVYRDEFFTSTIEIKPQKNEWNSKELAVFVNQLISEELSITSGTETTGTVRFLAQHLTEQFLMSPQILTHYTYIIAQEITPKPDESPESFRSPDFYAVSVRRIENIEDIEEKILFENQINVSVFKYDLIYYNFHNAFLYCKNAQEVDFYLYIYEVFKLLSIVLRYCDIKLNRLLMNLSFGEKITRKERKKLLNSMEQLWLDNIISVECYKALASVASFRAERAVERVTDVLGTVKLKANLDSKIANVTHLLEASHVRRIQQVQQSVSLLYYIIASLIGLGALLAALSMIF